MDSELLASTSIYRSSSWLSMIISAAMQPTMTEQTWAATPPDIFAHIVRDVPFWDKVKYEQVCRSWRDLLAKSPSPGVWGHLWTLVGSPAPERYGEDQEPIIFVPDTPKQGNRRAAWLAQRASGVRRIGFGNPEHYLVLPNPSLSSPLCRLLGRPEVLNIPTLDAYLPGSSLLLGVACRPLKRLCSELCVGPGVSQQYFENIAQFSRLTALSIASQTPAYNSSQSYHDLPNCLTNLINLERFGLYFSPCMPTALSTLPKLDDLTLAPCSGTSAICTEQNLEGFSTLTSLALQPTHGPPVLIKLPKGHNALRKCLMQGHLMVDNFDNAVQLEHIMVSPDTLPYLDWPLSLPHLTSLNVAVAPTIGQSLTHIPIGNCWEIRPCYGLPLEWQNYTQLESLELKHAGLMCMPVWLQSCRH